MPASYLDGDEPHVDVGLAPDDAEVLEEGDFGAAEPHAGPRLPHRPPRRPARRRRLGRRRLRRLRAGRPHLPRPHGQHATRTTDTLELAAALTAWVAAGPEGAASTGVDGDDLTLHACDPGDAEPAEPSERSPMDTLTLAAVRTLFVADFASTGAPPEAAACFGDAVIDAFSIDELTGEEAPPDMRGAHPGCGGGLRVR